MKHQFTIDKVFVNHKEQKFKTPCPIFIGKMYVLPLLKRLKIKRAYLAWRLLNTDARMKRFLQVSILDRVKLFLFKETDKYNFHKWR